MLKSADQFHGSDLEKIERLYGIRKEDIVSFGANVNPLGLSNRLREELARRLDVIATYPDREYKALREAIARYCKTKSEYVIPGNGSTELISLMIRLRKPKHALILAPAYSEYERETALAGGKCTYFPLDEAAGFVLDETRLIDALPCDADLLIVCNPNNPTSSIITANQMRHILEECRRRAILVLVDETYVEFAPDYDNVTSVPLTQDYDNLVVLRGVSKFFASPGLRLGYAVTSDLALVCAAAKEQNPWSVSSIAETAGQLLFTDTDYIHRTKELIGSERERIQAALRSIKGVKFYTPYANFILVRLLKDDMNARDLFDAAIRRGLMIRDCSSFPFLDRSYFRFCFMKPVDNDRLLDCIRQFLGR